jgi:two-component system, OmpR family, phosphate regulon sensor histidine kinase PhoR
MRLRFDLGLRVLALTLGLVMILLGLAKTLTEEESIRARDQWAEADLEVRLDLVRARALVEGSVVESQKWDALADELSAAAQARVTFLDIEGNVRGDSAIALERLGDMDNHANRPEVGLALRGQSSSARRKSTTTGLTTHYVARPLVQEGQVRGVVRLALDERTPKERPFAWGRPLGVTLLAGIVLAFVLSVVVSTLFAGRARHLSSVARRLSEGDLSARARAAPGSELDELGHGLNHLGFSLSRTLNALEEERDRMRGILSNMDEGVLFLDEDGRIALINPKLREMLLLEGEVTGRSVLEIIRHADLKELLDSVFDDEEEGSSVQGDIRFGGLKPRQLLVRARRLEGPEVGLVAVFTDVTEMRCLENLRREFVANVSHELRTPVATIRSAAETLESVGAGDRDAVAQFVGIIARNVQRLQALVEDLLDLSRIDARSYSLTLEAIHPREVVDPVLRLHGERASARQIRLVAEIPTDFSLIRVDRKALEHVLSNLVDNGVKYAGVGKTITVRALSDGDMARIEVADDGAGIEERHLSRLFERFYRVDPGRSRDVGGTGLGLSIVKNLTESMGGRVSVESKLGVGTVFTVRLPCAAARGSIRPPRVA